MNETTLTIILAVIAALGSIITAVTARLAKKGVNYLDHKTSFLDESSNRQKKYEIKSRIVEVAELAVKSTMQTYADELKKKSSDGVLTKKEAKEAFNMTWNKACYILSDEGVPIASDLLTAAIETYVNAHKKRPGGA